MKEIFVILLLCSTAIVGLASTDGMLLNDTLTVGEGAQRNVQNQAIRTVVIDPGHGGRDAGCSGAHSEEKKIALELSLAFGKMISSRHPEIEVIFTRDSDKFVALYERARIANKAQADLFISIHCNSLVGHNKVNGSETYVMGLHNADHNLNVAKRENEAVQLEENVDQNYSFDPNTPAGHITLSMFQHAFQEQSIAIAEHLEHRLGQRDGRRTRGVRMAGFVVLKETAMPSVLVETGYLSNETEELYLSEINGQLSTVNALYDGFADYLNARNVEQRVDRTVLASQVNAPVTNNPIPLFPTQAPLPTQQSAENTAPTSIESSLPATKFYIQIAAAKTQIDIEQQKWRSLEVPVRYVREGEYLKYQAGPFATKAEAEKAQEKALSKGFQGAFTVGYTGEQKLTSTELEAEK
ncbi:MAG: N-acetylmuramoyl-L-alanine amidase [Saprospiraceae bacterium]